MNLDFASEKPIYLQIADQIEDAIFTGAFAEDTQIPSTTEISTQFTINPATVLKGMNLLVERGLIYKKRGVGMFVQQGAVQSIRKTRRAHFFENYVLRMLQEAEKLGLRQEEIVEMIERGNH